MCAELRYRQGDVIFEIQECGIDDRVSRLSCHVWKYDCTWRTKYERDGFVANNPSKWFLCVLLSVSHTDSVF